MRYDGLPLEAVAQTTQHHPGNQNGVETNCRTMGDRVGSCRLRYPSWRRAILECQSIQVYGLVRYLGSGTQAGDEHSWNTRLSRYLGFGAYPDWRRAILEYQATQIPELRYLGLGTQAGDEQSWNTRLSKYLG